jgi:hypothetical protein
VTFDEEKTNTDRIVAELAKTGYSVLAEIVSPE